MRFYCVKCKKEINPKTGFYNYPSGIMCAHCGAERVPAVEKALNDELKKMAKELKSGILK